MPERTTIGDIILRVCRIIYLFLTILFMGPAFAQNSSIESIEKELATRKAVASRVDLLNTLCWNYIPIDVAKAKQYCDDSIQLAEKLKYKKGLSRGVVLLANIYFGKGDYKKSLELNHSGLVLREELGDEHGVAAVYGNIGYVYKMMNQIDKSLEYQLLSLEKFRTLNSINPNNDDAFDIAICLLDIGDIYKGQNKYDEAMKAFREALALFEKLKHRQSIAAAFSGMGDVYYRINNIKPAVDYNLKALAIYDEMKDKQGISNVYLNLANISMNAGDNDRSIQYLNNSLLAAKEISLSDNIKTAYELFANLYEKKGDYKLAYEYHKMYSEMKDSLLNIESSKQITEMQTKYETAQKEQQITLLNKDKVIQEVQLNRQKIVIWSVAGGLLLALLLSIFIFRERRKSEKLLLNILPAETARELKASGKAKAKHYEQVTVMFTDFKGFTGIAERLSAEELVGELDFLFKKFDEIISRYPIEKIKTIGDAYMCAGGLPSANRTHARDVVSAALEIQEWMLTGFLRADSDPLGANGAVRAGVRSNADEPPGAGNRPLIADYWQLRIGIHTGSVTAGVVGDKKFAYDIWGDTVNVASRMESSGEAGKVNISGMTYQSLQEFKSPDESREGMTFKFRGKIPAKNKGEIEMYFVEGSSAGSGPK